MIFRLGGFSKRSAADLAAAEAMKTIVRNALSLSEDVAVTVSEISCADPACPTLETIVLVMELGKKTVAYKVHGRLTDLTADDVRAALATAAHS